MISFAATPPENTGEALANAGSACRESFAELAVQLVDVQNAVMALLELFGRLATQLDTQGDGHDPVAEAERAAQTLLNALSASPDQTYGRALATTRETLWDFAQEARSLKAYASLTRLTAASLHVGGFEGYVVEVHQIADEVRAHADILTDRVDMIERERGPAVKAQRAAELDLRAMLDNLGPARAAQAGLAGEDLAFRADLARRVERLSQGGLTEISSLISMVQFADQFAQRLEHIETILGSDADRESVTILAAAQEAALVEDAEEICSSAVAALGRLGAIAGRSNLVEGEDLSSSPVGRLLQAHRAALDCVQQCNDATAASLAAAAAAAGHIVSAIDGAKRQFDSLRAIAESVGIAATNALLLPGRTGEARLPLGVLATAVRGSCAAFRSKTAIASQAMAGLSEGFEPELIASLKEGLDGFDTSVRLCSTRIETADTRAVIIGDLLSQIGLAVGTLEKAVRKSRGVMDEVLGALRDLRGSSAPRPRGTVNPQPLDPFVAIYTMAREREVHAAVTGMTYTEPATSEAEIEFF